MSGYFRITAAILSSKYVQQSIGTIRLPKNEPKHLFAEIEIGFTGLVILFLEHWMYFWVDWTYCCQDMSEIFYSSALTSNLLHLSYFYNIGGYFASIGGMFGKIWRKPSIIRFLNRVYGINNYIFRTFDDILCRLEVWLRRYRLKYLFAGIEFGLTALAVQFLEQWRLFCVDWR